MNPAMVVKICIRLTAESVCTFWERQGDEEEVEGDTGLVGCQIYAFKPTCTTVQQH